MVLKVNINRPGKFEPGSANAAFSCCGLPGKFDQQGAIEGFKETRSS